MSNTKFENEKKIFDDLMRQIPIKSLNLNYELGEMIGSGSDSIIFKAKRKDNQQIVAIKRIKNWTQLTKLAQQKKDWVLGQNINNILLSRLHEAHMSQILKDFCQPFIVCFEDFFRDDQTNEIFLVTNYIEGQSLETYIQSLVRLDNEINEKFEKISLSQPEIAHFLNELYDANVKIIYDEIYVLAKTLLQTLNFIHHHGLIHGDIRPDNIRIRKNTNNPVVLDFGSSCLIDTSNPCQNHGDPHFLAPEFQQNGHLVPKSDLWSLGLTLYSCFYENPYSSSFSARPNFQLTLDSSSEKLNFLVNQLLIYDVNLRPDAESLLKSLDVKN